MKTITTILILLFLSFGVKAQTFINNTTQSDTNAIVTFKGGLNSDLMFQIKRDWVDTANTFGNKARSYMGSIIRTGNILWVRGSSNGNTTPNIWYQLATGTIPSTFNAIQGYGLLLTGTYPNITFTVDTTSGYLATWALLKKKIDSLAATIPAQFNLSVNAPIAKTGTYPNITILADTGRAIGELVTGGSLNKVKDSLQSNINLKLNISDTASMLAPFVQYSDTVNMLSNLLRKTDTTNMLIPYLRKSDTSTFVNGYIRTIGITPANGVSGSSSGGQNALLTLILGNIMPTSVSASGAITGTTFAGTLVTSAQPNITSLGQLTGISVSGFAGYVSNTHSSQSQYSFTDKKYVDSLHSISGVEYWKDSSGYLAPVSGGRGIFTTGLGNIGALTVNGQMSAKSIRVDSAIDLSDEDDGIYVETREFSKRIGRAAKFNLNWDGGATPFGSTAVEGQSHVNGDIDKDHSNVFQSFGFKTGTGRMQYFSNYFASKSLSNNNIGRWYGYYYNSGSGTADSSWANFSLGDPTYTNSKIAVADSVLDNPHILYPFFVSKPYGNSPDGLTKAQAGFYSNTFYGVGVGGVIALGGRTGLSSDPYTFAFIRGAKSDLTTYGGFLSFHTTSNGVNAGELNGDNYERMRIEDNGQVMIGDTTALGADIKFSARGGSAYFNAVISDLAAGGYFQSRKNGTNVMAQGVKSGLIGLGNGAITFVYGANPYSIYINGVEDWGLDSTNGYEMIYRTPQTSVGTFDVRTRNNITGQGEIVSSSFFGKVQSVSITTANGISGTVLSPTTTPAITLTLGAITPTSVNSSGPITATTFAGTLVTPAQPNITSVGNLTSLTVTGSVNASQIVGTTLVGTLLTANQPNITNVGTLGALTVTNSITAANVYANLIGNASTVTTNHNMTGPITGTGNTTSITSQTGTGTTFVMDTSPTINGSPVVTSSNAATNFVIDNTGSNFGSNLGLKRNGTVMGWFGTYGALVGSADYSPVMYGTAGQGAGIYTNGNNPAARWDLSQNMTAYGSVNMKNYWSTSSSPSVAAGASAGASPTISIGGTNQGFSVTITPGTLPTGSGILWTATFSNSFAFPNGSFPTVSATSANAALLSGVSMVYVQGNTTTVTMYAGSTALTSGVTYSWNVTTNGY